MPAVSVIIPTYNRANLVTNAIESVLSQTYNDLEIIVADDGSTDDTGNRIKPYMDRITYFHQSNEGKSVATNRAMERAKGTWIAILDSDDVWLPEKLELQMDALERVGDGCGFCFTDGLFVNNPHMNGGVFVRIGKRLDDAYGRIEDPASYVLEPRHGIYIQTTLIDKALLESVGGFDPKLRVGQDTDMIFKMALKTKFVYVNRPLVKIDRTPRRKQGNIEVYRQDPQKALTCRQHMYETWMTLGQHLQAGLQNEIRTRLAGVHNDWANWHITEERQTQALEELNNAFRLSGSYRFLAKSMFLRVLPSMGRRVYRTKAMKRMQQVA